MQALVLSTHIQLHRDDEIHDQHQSTQICADSHLFESSSTLRSRAIVMVTP